MSNNDWKGRLSMVYSTNPDYQYPDQDESQSTATAPTTQDLRVWLERYKGGKQATVVRGFVGNEDQFKELAKLLKSRCGVGGSAKDGEIIVQGNVRDKVVAILQSEGYRVKKAGS